MRIHSAHILAVILLVAAFMPHPARAADNCDTCPDFGEVASAALDVQLAVSDLKTALLATAEPSVRASFSLLNNLDARAGQIETIALGSMGDQDIMAIAFIVMMEAAQSAREDLKAIMDGVNPINKQKEGWASFSAAQQQPAVALATDRLIGRSLVLLSFFPLPCIDCE